MRDTTHDYDFILSPSQFSAKYIDRTVISLHLLYDCMTDSMTIWPTIWPYVWQCMTDSMTIWQQYYHMTVWPTAWPYNCMSDSLTNCMNDSMTVWPTVWPTVWMTVWLYDRQYDRQYDRMTDSRTVWLTVWQTVWPTVWPTVWLRAVQLTEFSSQFQLLGQAISKLKELSWNNYFSIFWFSERDTHADWLLPDQANRRLHGGLVKGRLLLMRWCNQREGIKKAKIHALIECVLSFCIVLWFRNLTLANKNRHELLVRVASKMIGVHQAHLIWVCMCIYPSHAEGVWASPFR